MRTSMNEQNNTNISQFNSNCSSRTPSNSIKDVSSIDLQQEGSTLTIQASGVAEQTNVVKSRVRQNNLHWRDDQQVFSKHDAYSSKRVRNVGRGGKLRSSPAKHFGKISHHRCNEAIDRTKKVIHDVLLLLDDPKVSNDALHSKRLVMENEIIGLVRELDFVISSASGVIIKDNNNKVVNEGVLVLFDAVAILEEDATTGIDSTGTTSPSSSPSTHKSKSWDTDASTTVIWDSITTLLSNSLIKAEHNKRAIHKRTTTSLMKFENDEAEVILRAIERSIINILGIERNDHDGGILYTPLFNNQEVRYKKLISILKCLRIFLTGFSVYLSNEHHLQKVVENLIIPFLSVDLTILTAGKEIQSVKVQKMLEIHVEVLQCTTQILRWKQSSSTLLSSQCNIIHFDTRRIKEHGLMSPSIGETLLHVLMNIMNVDAYLKREENSWISYSCECLITLLKTLDANIRKTRKNKALASSLPDQMQIAHFFKWVHKSLQLHHTHILGMNLKTTSSMHALLELLKTLVQLYPKSCAQFWALFIPPPTSFRQVKYEHDGTKVPKYFNLLLIMSMSENNSTVSFQDIRVMAMQCCKDILQALPFYLWSRSGYLAGRIESSLQTIIDTTVVILSKQISVDEMEALYPLTVTIITVVPFEKYSVLMDSAVGLVKQIAQNYLKYGLHGGLGLEVVVQALIDSLGGKEMPNGDITPLPLPMHQFLIEPMSSPFLSQLFFKISEISSKNIIERGTQTMIQMQLFVQVVKSATWILNGNSKRLQSMIDLLMLLLSSDDKMLKITGSELLSAFIIGKNQGLQTVCSDDEELPVSLYECLYATLSENDPKIRCSVLSTYSLMSFKVWRVLLGTMYNPLKTIMSLAIEYSGDRNSTVRSGACKALGNIITILIEGYCTQEPGELSKAILDSIIEETATVTVNAAVDSNSSVRSMALFAIGNIAFDSVQSKNWGHVKLLPMQKLCKVVYESLFDENEKVVSNAIRTSGHFYSLLNLQIQCSDEIPTATDLYLEFCDKFLEKLGDLINQAVADAIQVSDSKTWKQRMNTKKQAWGACQAYSSILRYSSLMQSLPSEVFEMAILNLIRCVENAHDLNEKIFASALHCLTLIDMETWKSFSFESEIRGRCLVACLSKEALKSFIPVVQRDVQFIMTTVTRCFGDRDVDLLVTDNENVNEHLENLYLWMVENSSASQMFEAFGEALSTSSKDFDISLVQRFKSRAVWEKRRRVQNIENWSGSESDGSDDDEL